MKDIFIKNPELDVCYMTADQKCFFLENDALNWASTLEDKKVEKLIRENQELEKVFQLPQPTDQEHEVKDAQEEDSVKAPEELNTQKK